LKLTECLTVNQHTICFEGCVGSGLFQVADFADVALVALRRDTPFIKPRFYGTGVETQASRDFQVGYAPGAAEAADAFRVQCEPLSNFDDVQELFHNDDLSPVEM